MVIVVMCLLAPVYAAWAGVDPFSSTLDAVITIDGKEVPVMEQSTEGLGLGFNPIGLRGDSAIIFSVPTTRAGM